MGDHRLELDQFVRAIAVNRAEPHALFLGSGASVTSGVPAADTCVWMWKRAIVASNDPRLADQLAEIGLASVRDRLQRWLDLHGGFPPRDDPTEYGYYAERAYPIADDRRRFFQGLCAGAQPHVGYRALAMLAESGMAGTVWTTNFDGLAARAGSQRGVVTIEVGLDSTGRISRPTSSGELLCVSLHGDYRYDSLKNTSDELRDQDLDLRNALVDSMSSTSLAVIGYSGRDASVMAALEAAFRRPGSGRLYWCTHGDAPVPDAVERLLDAATGAGREARLVPASGFDDVMARIAMECLTGQPRRDLTELLAVADERSSARPRPFSLGAAPVHEVVKSNAYPLSLPRELLQFEARLPERGAWRLVREACKTHAIVAGPHGRGRVLALGTADDIAAALKDLVSGPIERTPVGERDLQIEDGVVVSLLTEALARAIAETRTLGWDGRTELWEPGPSRVADVDGQRVRIRDSCLIALRRYGGQQYLVLKPTIRVEDSVGEPAEAELAMEAKRQVLGRQWNQLFNSAVDRWRRVLFAGGSEFEFPPGAASPFRFSVTTSPAFAGVNRPGARPAPVLPRRVGDLLRYRGIEISEPDLVFAGADGGRPRDSHPIRGILQNRPFDFGLTASGLLSSVSVGVVCPQVDSRRLAAFLATLHQQRSPEQKEEYLVPYPGFAQAFATPLDLPQPGSGRWEYIAEPDPGASPQKGGPELGRAITRAVEHLRAGSAPDVILVYVPRRWQPWERFRTDAEAFDLHDHVKAFGVQRGVGTQLLREVTLGKPGQCEVRWWLALSLYAKSMRTPWVLDGLDQKSAYLGLGFSVNPTPGGAKVVLGCGHLYGADGLGLQYKLSKVEDPVFRQRNAYMSRDDARRLGETVRQLFYESRGRLPDRVVVHKQTPYLPAEQAGLIDGLQGVGQLELVQITEEPMLRYVASRLRDGQLEGHGFPIRRGTVLVLGDATSLIWVHGSASAVQPGKLYYQGKSRIPAPLLMRRFHGDSDVQTLASEVLGLSKMNWNTFDLYTKLPATIHSSRQIAGIGRLLERFGPLSYDYRLFI